MKSRADWGNRQGNSARCFLYVLNEINNLGRQFWIPSAPQTLTMCGRFLKRPFFLRVCVLA